SIGIHFMTDTANNRNGSSDIYMTSNDIAGVQLQAYWINATNNMGATGDGVALPDSLNDSSNNVSAITFEYATSARWGSGVRTATPVERMLNGTVGAANTAATDQT